MDLDRGASKAQGPPIKYVTVTVVDEVEVPHREMGANRKFGKIDRSADASQSRHALIQCPFELQYVKP